MDIVPDEFQSFMLNETRRRSAPLDVLEVGGGAVSHFDLRDSRVTVLDSSSEALVRNDRAAVKLVGDAQEFDYRDRRFDLAIFWNVLEHVPAPEAAIERACGSLRPDGMIVVRGPELKSLKSIVARLTPHWVHVLYYRRVLRIRDAGRDGRPPCRIQHSPGADRVPLIDKLKKLGFSLQYEQRYVGDQVVELRRYSGLAYRIYTTASALLRLLTRSRYGARETEFILVARRGVGA